ARIFALAAFADACYVRPALAWPGRAAHAHANAVSSRRRDGAWLRRRAVPAHVPGESRSEPVAGGMGMVELSLDARRAGGPRETLPRHGHHPDDVAGDGEDGRMEAPPGRLALAARLRRHACHGRPDAVRHLRVRRRRAAPALGGEPGRRGRDLAGAEPA